MKIAMIQDTDRTKVIGRRALLLGGAKTLLLGTLAARMYYLQVNQADKYITLSDENRINLRLLAPPRGRILDRNGVAMAVNQENYRVLVVSEDTDDIDDTLDSLANIIPISDRDRARIIREAKHRRSFVPVTVRENLSWEDVSRIEINTPDLPGVKIDVGQSRSYPLVGLGAHLLGYVSAVSEQELQQQAQPDPLLELPGARIGKAGLEKVYDLALRGKGGTSQVEVNSVGREIRVLKSDEGEAGLDLNLTIDLDLQRFAAQRLGDESAAVVVMDIHTGEVLVMASTPSFDPNAFNRGLTADEWKDLTTNPRSPLTNKAIAGQYAPGSTFKTMVSLAALESGIITKDHTVVCGGRMYLGNQTRYCDKVHGALDMKQAIAQSCDIYYYDVARRVGIDTIAAMAKRFGLGSRLDVDLPQEAPGLVPSRAWKRSTYGVPWTPGEDLNAGIGQGYLLVTPLQLATQAARIANGGFAVQPHLARDKIVGRTAEARDFSQFPSLGIAQSSLDTVVEGMTMAAGPGGTVFLNRIQDPAMAMAGKTGTAQVHHLAVSEHRLEGFRKIESLPWKMRDNALFIGFAPVGAPRFSISVIVEHGGFGGQTAVPIARDILIEVQKRYPPTAVQQQNSPCCGKEGDHSHDHDHG